MIRQANLMAGGQATRFGPTKIPKALQPIPENGKPVMGYVLDLALAAGINQLIVTYPESNDAWAKQICDYTLEEYLHKFKDITFIRNAGSYEASVIKASHLYNGDVLLLASDIFSNADLSQLASAHEDKKSLVSLITFESQNAKQCGIVVERNGRKAFVPKNMHTEQKGNVDTAFYAIAPGFVELLKGRDFDSAIMETFNRGQANVSHQGIYWFDINTPEKYKVACDYARAHSAKI
jgi:NDP-sugar pyrophosphorylase family protein